MEKTSERIIPASEMNPQILAAIQKQNPGETIISIRQCRYRDGKKRMEKLFAICKTQ